jgi:YVTN family beta-propeller protein
VDFALLGPVAVGDDGHDVPLSGPKQRALLVLLLLDANRVVSRDRLIDGLWGERPPPSASHTLDDYLSRLRKVLGPDRLIRHPPGYLLRVEPLELDLDRFSHQLEAGRAALARGDPIDAASKLRAALALWRGVPLADVLNEPFAAREADRLEGLRLDALQDRIAADLALGRAGELVSELEQLVRDHPLRERLVGQLMLALYREGRQDAALEAFRRTRLQLVAELGLEPGAPLRRLEREILDQDPSLDVARPRRVTLARRRRPVWVATIAAICVAAIAFGLIARPGGTPASDPVARADGGLARLDARSGAIVATATTGGLGAIADAGGALWLADPVGNALLRADAGSGRVVDRVPLAAQPGAVATGDGDVWVAETGGTSLQHVAAATDTVTQSVSLPSTPGGLCLCAGALWVTAPGNRSLTELNARTGTVRRTVRLAISPTELVAAAGALWVSDYDAGTITQVDPRSGSAVGTVHVGQGPDALTVGGGAVWVANRLDGTVSRIDPSHATVAATIAAGGAPTALAYARGAVWVADGESGTVARIDPTSGVVAGAVRVGGQPRAISAAGATLWIGSAPLSAHRGGTFVTLASRRFSSVDPQIEYEMPAAQFLGLIYDGLVAYDHTTGAEGLRLVPDLAMSLPSPADGGRTYTFRLRPGLRYSDGRPVLASDFARGMSRLFRVSSPGAGFFTSLAGGRACARRPAACSLARGVRADDAARTVAFHLATADPYFLPKLTLGFVVPIPPGTPTREVGGAHPMPGTGPYRFASIGGREFRMVRNPRFREWSAAAQPDGNPDALVWRFGSSPERNAETVADGRADWAPDTPSNLAAVARHHPGAVHSNTFPTELFAQLNTRRPPFDDLRVRRALNFAIDRRAIVDLKGGPLASTPSCQVIPAGLQGHRGYCPYTLDPRRSGRWLATDLKRARALVAASGTRGAPVTVWTVSDNGAADPVARTLAATLRRLGYRARVHVLSSDRLGRLPAHARWAMQLLPIEFGPDYPSPSEIFSLFLACRGAFTWRQFCDHRLDHRLRHLDALTVRSPARAAALWPDLDRQMVRRAVWIPLVDDRIVDVTSARLRNYQFSPVYHFMPAQAGLR